MGRSKSKTRGDKSNPPDREAREPSPSEGTKSSSGRANHAKILNFFRNDFFYYLLAAIAPWITLWIISGGFPSIWYTPVTEGGDVVMQLPYAQTVIDGESWIHMERLGAPHGHNLYNFPMNSHIDFFLLALFAKITGTAGVAMIWAWLFRLSFAGLLGAWSFRNLRISRTVSIAAAVLFSLIPYMYIRLDGHYNLATYFIPVTCSLAILCLSGRFDLLTKRRRLLYFMLCFFVGLNGPYTAFFSCTVLAFAAVFSFSFPLRWIGNIKRAVTPASAIALILLGTAISSIPGILAFQESPRIKEITYNRAASDCDTFGLRISSIITPLPENHIPLFDRFGRLMKDTFKPNFEGGSEYIGLIGAIGFIVLLFTAARRCTGIAGHSFTNRGPPIENSSSSRITIPAVLTLAAVFLGTIGGFSNFVALYFPTIRSYGRIATFIAFFSILAIAVVIDRLRAASLHRIELKKRSRAVLCWSLALVVFTLLGAREQHQCWYGTADDPALQKLLEKTQNLENFLAELEQNLPEDAMVYQYPDVNQQGRMQIYEHMKAYFLSHGLRFSYVWHDARGDKTYQWLDAVSKLKMGKQAEALLFAGFDAVWIECKAYDDAGQGLIQYYSSLPKVRVFTHGDSPNRIVVFDLQEFRKLLIDDFGGEEAYRARQIEILKDPSILKDPPESEPEAETTPTPSSTSQDPSNVF